MTTVEQAADRADELEIRIAAVVDGEAFESVLAALLGVATDVIAEMSDSPERARTFIIERMAPMMVANVAKRLLAENRLRQ